MGEKFPAKAADNWDLQAVVRCFSSANNTTANYTPQIDTTTSGTTAAADESSLEDPLAFLATMKFDKDDDPFSFPNLFENKNIGFQELEDSYKPFYSTPSSAPEGLFNHQQQQQQLQLNSSIVSPMSSSSFPPFVIGEQNNQQTHYVQQPLQQQDPQIHQQKQQQLPMRLSSAIPLRPAMPSHAHRSRKRKSPIKKMVCQVTEEKLSADLWAWRKYGQKPIKGSPYPRNYYRCSSSKGCAARKQVERSNTDPNIYIVSYTGDHTHPRPTHRNSLAGSTRNKFSGTQNHPVSTTPPPPPLPPPTSSSSPLSATCQSPSAPTTPAVDEEMSSIENILANEADHNKDTSKTLMEEEEEEDDDDLFEDLLIPNLAAPGIDEDFFKGLKQFGSTAASGSGDNHG
ncbi:hypothetical protein AB3S75_045898 [Citrus x aurantiifolia]